MRFAPCDGKPEISEQRWIRLGQPAQRVAHPLPNRTRALAAEKIEHKRRVDRGIALIELNAEIHALEVERQGCFQLISQSKGAPTHFGNRAQNAEQLLAALC